MRAGEAMKIGILETGRPPAELEPRFGRYDGMITCLLGKGYSATTYEVGSSRFPDRPEDQDAYIVTGSSAGVYEDHAWIPSLKTFLREAKGKAKLVGICFGHQIMAEAFGGRVEKSEKGWGIGLHRYDVRHPAGWMDPVDSFAVPASHQDQIVEQPPASRIIAASAFTSFAALEYEDQPAISFQCHPEFSHGFAEALIEQRRARLPNPEAALKSLEQPDDRLMVGGWIRRFLEGRAL
jgi:GMP synthase-like glutamine amidotransferase